MATLFNTKISNTYQGLLKTVDNAAISATLRELTDGSGNQSGLYLNTAGDFKVTNVLEWGSLKDTGTGVTITQFVTSTDGIENFNNNTTLPTSAAVKLYVDTKFSQTDTLAEVLSFGNETLGNSIIITTEDDVFFRDNSMAIFGNTNDLSIYHDGSSSYIRNTTGNLEIASNSIFFKSIDAENIAQFIKDDAVKLFFDNIQKFQTTSLGAEVTGDLLVTGTITGAGGSFLPLAGGTMTGNIVLNDNVRSIYGTASDGLQIFHNGTDSLILDSGTGNLRILGSTSVRIQNQGDNADMIVANSGNGVNLYYNNSKKLETTNTGATVTGALSTTTNVTVGANATFVDNGKAIFGAGSDLQIYHDGGSSIIRNLTGGLYVETSLFQVNGNGGSELMIKANENSSVELYYNAIKKFETVTDGARVTGNLEVTGTITGAGGSFLPLIGGTMTGDTIHNDNVKSIYGTASDGLEIYHDGSNSFISEQGTGNLNILASTSINLLNGNSSDYMARFNDNGSNQFFYDGSKKVETTNTGISVTGNGVYTGNVFVNDNQYFSAGNGADFRLLHSSSDNSSYIQNYTGNLYIDQRAVTESIFFRVSNANALDTTALTISRNGDLTTGRDVTIAGDLTVNGTTTTVNSQTLSVDDPLISLAINNAANSLDIGYYGKYNDGTTRYLGLFNDASDSNKFKLFKGTTVEPTTTVNIGAAGYVAADLELSSLTALGSTSAPSMFLGGYTYHSGDANTYFGFPANDRFAVSAGGNVNLELVSNGVTLRHTGDTKLITTSTGVSVTGGGTFTGNVLVGSGTIDNPQGWGKVLQVQNSGANGASLSVKDSNNEWNLATYLGVFNISDGVEERLTIDSSGNTTFAGDVNVGTGLAGTVNVGLTDDYKGVVEYLAAAETNLNIKNTYDGAAAAINFQLRTSGTTVNALTLLGSGNAIFAGSVTSTDYRTAVGNVFYLTSGGDWRFRDNASGAERMRITSGGNVGIGATSPSSLLNVNSVSAATESYLDITSGSVPRLKLGYSFTDAPSISDADAWVTVDSSGNLDLSTRGNANSNIQLYTSDGNTHSEKMRIGGDGNVGIGTTSPDSLLHVSADIATGGVTKTGTITIEGRPFGILGDDIATIDFHNNGNKRSDIRMERGNTADDSQLIFSTSDAGTLNDALIINEIGNVGIGTDSPSALLEVSSITGANIRLTSTGNGLGAGSTIGSLEYYGSDISAPGAGIKSSIVSKTSRSLGDDSNLIFSTSNGLINNVERVRIDLYGNVGIGTDSPIGKLDVSDGTNPLSFDSSTYNEIQSYNRPLLINRQGNNVGIGTDTILNTAAGRTVLTIGGSVSNFLNFSNASSSRRGGIYTDDTQLVLLSDTYLKFETGSTVSERMRITSAGEMKIGEFGGTDPSRIQVGGNSTTARIIPYNDNVGYIGDSSHRWQAIYSTNGNIQTSDIREKTEIKPIQLGLDFVNDLNPVSYKWIENERLDASKDKRNHQGLIAQEVAKTLEKHGVDKNEFGGLDIQKTDKYKDFHGMSYEQLVAPMIKAIQELTAKVERLEAK